MPLAIVQFVPWDKPFAFETNGLEIRPGMLVVVNADGGQDAGKVIELADSGARAEDWGYVGMVERVANRDDADAYEVADAERQETVDYCRYLAKKHGLDMKIVDCHLSFDGQRLTFAFIADGRIDFRNLVKDLSRHFQKSIRLHQLGVRDEAKIEGDIGCCGIEQCCKSHLKKLGSVTSEFAENQQVAHRGSERLSGVCGRLKCCLAYENDLYQEMAAKLPPIGTRVKTKHGRGVIVGWHTLKCSVDVRIDPDKEGAKDVIVEVPIDKKDKDDSQNSK